jgi:RNA polymerase sigma factor (sigma-70 family)
MPNSDLDDTQPPPQGVSPADGALIRKIRAGDADALRMLMGRYDRLVRYTVYRTCQARCAADPDWLDARASETWSGFVRSIRRPAGEAPDDLASYFCRIARNKCLDALRIAHAVREQTAISPEADLSQIPSEQEDASITVARLELLEALRNCIGSLDAADRRLCAQYELIVERRWRDAATRLDLPESTLRSRWTRILDRLRACLDRKRG